MTAKITIHNLGPIKDCTMELDHCFTVLTGKQASGKSTIAKAIYYCRSVKDDICEAILKYNHLNNKSELIEKIRLILYGKFLQMFGNLDNLHIGMKMRYDFSDDTFIDFSVKPSNNPYELCVIPIRLSSNIKDYIRSKVNHVTERSIIQAELNSLFNDEYETVYIPAGRNLISLLSSQLSYILATMDDDQKRRIDYCSLKYIERILKIRPLLEDGLEGLVSQKRNMLNPDEKAIAKLTELISKVLKGKYVFEHGEEKLFLSENNNKINSFVKLNYASSGQQETVWIFNILFHILATNTKAFIILEEPEAHLYPDAQKDISEILALMSNHSCDLLITTHSPYILGAVNNLIYADYIAKDPSKEKDVDELVDKECRISGHNAYYVADGEIHSCIEDTPERLIRNEVIDGASFEINQLYDNLFDIAERED